MARIWCLSIIFRTTSSSDMGLIFPSPKGFATFLWSVAIRASRRTAGTQFVPIIALMKFIISVCVCFGSALINSIRTCEPPADLPVSKDFKISVQSSHVMTLDRSAQSLSSRWSDG